MNRQALIISVVARVSLPLTFLTGLLGMNVDGIPYAHEPWAFGVRLESASRWRGDRRLVRRSPMAEVKDVSSASR